VPIADEDDAERQGGVDTVANELAVALLEDVERKGDARAKDRVEREEGELDGRFQRCIAGRDGRQSRANRKRRRLPGGVSPVMRIRPV
jgi:hypothetical protein